MPQPLRHKHAPHALLQHLLHIPPQYPELLQSLYVNPVCEAVDVFPVDSGLDGCEAGAVGAEDDGVDVSPFAVVYRAVRRLKQCCPSLKRDTHSRNFPPIGQVRVISLA